MKIKRIDTIGFVRSFNMKNSFLEKDHSLEYLPEYQCYLIDKICLLPLHRIAEVIVDTKIIPNLKQISQKEITEAVALADDFPKIKKKNVK